MDKLARERAIQIILEELGKTQEEPRMREEEPEIEIEFSKEDMPRSKRLEKAFDKVKSYGIK